MDHTKLKGCHPGCDPVGLKGPDGMNTLSSYQAGRDDMITIIKSEIERRQKENYKQAGLFAAGRVVEDADILSFLSTLESEKPMEGLDEEIQDKRSKLIEVFGPMNGEQVLAIKDFARHFAKWGAEHLKK